MRERFGDVFTIALGGGGKRAGHVELAASLGPSVVDTSSGEKVGQPHDKAFCWRRVTSKRRGNRSVYLTRGVMRGGGELCFSSRSDLTRS